MRRERERRGGEGRGGGRREEEEGFTAVEGDGKAINLWILESMHGRP